MNILIVCDRLDSYGGLESHVVTQVNELTKLGHKITLYTNAINDYHREVITYDKLICPWSLNCFYDIGDYIPDVVISHPFTAMDRACDIANKFNTRFIVIMHGLYDYGFDNSPFGHKIGNRVNAVIAVDNIVYKVMKNSYTCPKDRLYTIYNGIDTNKFTSLPFQQKLFESLSFQYEHKTLGIVTRLQDSKDVPLRQLLKVLPQLTIDQPLNIYICGGGKHFNEINDICNSISSDKLIIKACGNVTNIQDYLSLSCHTFASAKSALEAIACGNVVFQMGIGQFGEKITFKNYDDTLFDITRYRDYTDSELINNTLEFLSSPYDIDLVNFVRNHCALDKSINKLERIIKGEI